MKVFNHFCCLSLIVLCLSSFPCLSQAMPLNEEFQYYNPYSHLQYPNEIGLLDEKPWNPLLQAKAIKIKEDSASEIIKKLSALVFIIGGSEKHTTLEALDLSGSNITHEELRDLIRFIQRVFPNIKELNLSHINIGEAGAIHLAGLSRLPKLKSLLLAQCNLGSTEVTYLTELTQLESLDLFDNHIGDNGAIHLLHLTQLKMLDLTHNYIGDLGVWCLKELKELRDLNLSVNQIGDEGASHLKELKELRSLSLMHNHIRDEGMTYLAELTQLKRLVLVENNIGTESIDALKQTLVGCVILSDS